MLQRQIERVVERLNASVAGKAGVYAETLDGEECLAIHADELFPTASTIKIFILDALLARSDAAESNLGDRLELTPSFTKPGSGVLYHLDPGLRPSLRDLATLMMMISDNSAMLMLVDYLGLESINAEIERHGLERTRLGDWSRFEETYADSMGLGRSTPREMVAYLLRMRRGELRSAASTELFWDIMRIQKYILPLRRYLPASPWAREFNFPEPVWVASKGGTLDDCAAESGFVRVHDGGWAISVMLRDMPEIVDEGFDNHERLISEISRCVYDAWAPRYEPGRNQ